MKLCGPRPSGFGAVGYELVPAYDSATGISAAFDIKTNLILLDIRIPGIGGLSTLTKLREQESNRHIPVLILSGNVTEKSKTAAFELGSEYVLQKPCDTNTFG